MIVRAAIISSMMLVSNSLPAAAQDMAGAWSFRTDVERKGCRIEGNMTISPANDSGIRTCAFVSKETCGDDPALSWQIEQSCRIIPQADRHLIQSTVISSLTEGYDVSLYLPDHFILKQSSPTRMDGLWRDTQYSAPVVFWRDENTPIS
ncbi:MAG: hypothetical protein AAFQ84_11140 [Pseudomonadota bacterium]